MLFCPYYVASGRLKVTIAVLRCQIRNRPDVFREAMDRLLSTPQRYFCIVQCLGCLYQHDPSQLVTVNPVLDGHCGF